MATNYEKRQRLLTLDMKFVGDSRMKGGIATSTTELAEMLELCKDLGLVRAQAYYGAILASLFKIEDLGTETFTVAVLLYTREGAALHPETVDIQHARGELGREQLVRDMVERWKFYPDIKIIGPCNVVYKDIEPDLIK